MIESHPYLEEAKITNDIEKGFLQYYEKAENYAASGNVAAVKKVMDKFSKIKSKMPSVLHLIKIAYWAQIEQASIAGASDKVLQGGFSAYQKTFGYESMLDDVLKSIHTKRALSVSFDTGATKSYTGSIEGVPLSVIDS